MKAILVIDMPNTCDKCDYCGYAIVGEGKDEYKYRSCGLSQRYLGEIAEDSKDSLCPLKPLPTEFKTYKLSPRDQEETELFINMATIKVYADGYNACLKEIEGD